MTMMTRRDFVRASAVGAAGCGLISRGLLPQSCTFVKSPTSATADTLILLWMAGGMASTETFDPKRYEPFEIGLPAERILSTFPAIDTAVDDIKICKGLEHVAQVMDRGTLIRSAVVPDLGHILHSASSVSLAYGLCPAANRGCSRTSARGLPSCSDR